MQVKGTKNLDLLEKIARELEKKKGKKAKAAAIYIRRAVRFLK